MQPVEQVKHPASIDCQNLDAANAEVGCGISPRQHPVADVVVVPMPYPPPCQLLRRGLILEGVCGIVFDRPRILVQPEHRTDVSQRGTPREKPSSRPTVAAVDARFHRTRLMTRLGRSACADHVMSRISGLVGNVRATSEKPAATNIAMVPV